MDFGRLEFELSLGDLSPASSYSFRVQIPSVPFHSLDKVGKKGQFMEYFWPILRHMSLTQFVFRLILGTNIRTNKQDISISLYSSTFHDTCHAVF